MVPFSAQRGSGVMPASPIKDYKCVTQCASETMDMGTPTLRTLNRPGIAGGPNS